MVGFKWLLALAVITTACGSSSRASVRFDVVLPAGKTLRVTTTDRNVLTLGKLGARTEEIQVIYSLRIVAGGTVGRDVIRARARMEIARASWQRGTEPEQTWEAKRGGKPGDEIQFFVAMHRIEYDVSIALTTRSK